MLDSIILLTDQTNKKGERALALSGLVQNTLKKLNGLRFTFPSLLMVDAKAMGRGAIVPCK
jgi:hypothetical protein